VIYHAFNDFAVVCKLKVTCTDRSRLGSAVFTDRLMPRHADCVWGVLEIDKRW